MLDSVLRIRGPSSVLPPPHLLSVAMLLGLPGSATAQDTSQAAAVSATDSVRATGAACKVVESLRQEPRRYRCIIESFTATPTEYVMRVREVPRDRALPPPFHRSTVRLKKAEPSVTVIRVPEL